MSNAERYKQDLDYVASAVRRNDRSNGEPDIYFLWAVIVPIGFALADFAPGYAGAFWFVAGIGGGLLSWWLGMRAERRSGINDLEEGRRHGWHWLIGGVAFMLSVLPVASGQIAIEAMINNYLLIAGLLYALAGVHLERPLLWSGLMMFAAYAVLALFNPPYAWTITGVAIGLSLLWAGIAARRTCEVETGEADTHP